MAKVLPYFTDSEIDDMDRRPAPLASRVAAWLITFWMLVLYIGVVGLCLGAIRLSIFARLIVVFVVPILAISWEGAFERSTYGMRLMTIRIRSRSGEPIDFWWCFARILLAITLAPLAPISGVVALIDPRRRSLADLICGTAVWQEPKEREQPRRGFEVMPLEERQHL